MKELILNLFNALGSIVAFIVGALGAMHLVKSLLTMKPDDFETMKINWQHLKGASKKACVFMNNFLETNHYFRLFTSILCISFILLNVVLGSLESNLLILKGNYNILQILTPPILRVAASLPLVYVILPKGISRMRMIG